MGGQGKAFWWGYTTELWDNIRKVDAIVDCLGEGVFPHVPHVQAVWFFICLNRGTQWRQYEQVWGRPSLSHFLSRTHINIYTFSLKLHVSFLKSNWDHSCVTIHTTTLKNTKKSSSIFSALQFYWKSTSSRQFFKDIFNQHFLKQKHKTVFK